MNSWWRLGESGYSGDKLSIYRITCAFCMETGKFKTVFHTEKNKPNSDKRLNFDTLECANCNGYVMVLWSASEYGGRLHDYRILPWPLQINKYPEHWPERIGTYWLQAQRNILDENWDAAVVMARSALQIALRDHQATGNSLKQEIDDLASKGILPPTMQEWANHIRELGNDSAHPNLEQGPTNPQDACDIVEFLNFLLEYLYTFPHQIQQYQERRESDE